MRRLTLCLTFLAFAGCLPAVDHITIDADRVVRDTTISPLGLNLNYLVDDEARRPPGAKRTLVQAVAQTGARFLRYPGGEKSDNYVWSTRAGSTALLSPQDEVPTPLQPRIADPGTWPGMDRGFADAEGRPVEPSLDFDEFITFCRGCGGEPVVVVAYDTAREISGSAHPMAPTLAELQASAAAWVRYANVTRGYGVKYWEIGNESWFRAGMTAERYATDVIAFAQAMRAVDPSIRIIAHGKDDTWYPTICAKASGVIDILASHDYSVWQWSGYDTFRTSSPDLARNAGMAIAAIASHAAPADRDRLLVAVTETNALDWGLQFGSGGWVNRNDLAHALVLFDLVGQQIRQPKIAFTQVWNSRWITNVANKAGSGVESVRDGGFEADAGAWTVSGPASRVIGAGHAGRVAMQVAGGAMVHQDVALVPGDSYSLSLWGRAESGTGWVGAGIDYLDAAGTKIGGFGFNFGLPDPWKQQVRPFTVPPGCAMARVWIHATPGSPKAWVDDISISDQVAAEIGDLFTPSNDWQPIGHALALWGRFLGDRLVTATGTADVLAYASTTSATGALTVWLLNKQPAAASAAVTIRGHRSAPTVGRWVFSGSTPEDLFPTLVQAADLVQADGEVTLTLAPLSITVLTFAR